MALTLTNRQFQLLQNYMEAGDRVAYYTLLMENGDAYAELALSVVQNEGSAGVLANMYAKLVAADAGINLTNAEWKQVSLDLMKADFSARQNRFENGVSLELGYSKIQAYHNSVFENHSLPVEAWTAQIILETSNTPASTWNNLINTGYTDIDNYYSLMNRLIVTTADEFSQYKGRLYLKNGAVNPNTYNNEVWMREHMPATYMSQKIYSPEIISRFLLEVADDHTYDVWEGIQDFTKFLNKVTNNAPNIIVETLANTIDKAFEVLTGQVQQWFSEHTKVVSGLWTGGVFVPAPAGSGFVTIAPRSGTNTADLISAMNGHDGLNQSGQDYVDRGETCGSWDDPSTWEDATDANGVTHLCTLIIESQDTATEHRQLKECPLVIDLDGDGIETTSMLRNEAQFDFALEGQTVARHGWISADDCLLALDRNKNSVIDNIHELFGSGSKNGFATLKVLDTNGDNRITAADDDFQFLVIWRDANGDGISQKNEFLHLSDLGVEAFDLKHSEDDWSGDHGNLIGARSSVHLKDGSTTTMADVYFSLDMETMI